MSNCLGVWVLCGLLWSIGYGEIGLVGPFVDVVSVWEIGLVGPFGEYGEW